MKRFRARSDERAPRAGPRGAAQPVLDPQLPDQIQGVGLVREEPVGPPLHPEPVLDDRAHLPAGDLLRLENYHFGAFPRLGEEAAPAGGGGRAGGGAVPSPEIPAPTIAILVMTRSFPAGRPPRGRRARCPAAP